MATRNGKRTGGRRCRDAARRLRRARSGRSGRLGLLGRLGPLPLLLVVSACVTPAEFRKLEHRVIDMERAQGSSTGSERSRIAELGAQLDAVRQSLDELEGRLEVAEHRLAEALEEARSARAEAAVVAVAATAPETPGDEQAEPPLSEEVQRYREAHAAWRSGDSERCIDQFRNFLQTYPASAYADDATFWLGDCYFKQGNFSAAVLRFDDVARRYPDGNKAADALYRQGEALLRMGHAQAAGDAFERVLEEYPDSARAPEARRQLDLLGAG